MIMEPGRLLDVEVGRRIIGVMVFIDKTNGDYKCINPTTKRPGILPYYSTKQDDAYILINFLQYRGYYANLGSSVVDGILQFWASFSKNSDEIIKVYGETMPHAVALAALEIK